LGFGFLILVSGRLIPIQNETDTDHTDVTAGTDDFRDAPLRDPQPSPSFAFMQGLPLTNRNPAQRIAEGETQHSPGWSEALRAQPWVPIRKKNGSL